MIKNIQSLKIVDSSNGNLRNLGFTENIRYKFSSDYRRTVDTSVKARAMARFSSITGTENPDQIRSFLTHEIAPISLAQLPRHEIKTHASYATIVNVVSQNHALLQVASETDQIYKNILVEGQIADWSGIGMKRNDKGTSGSYIVHNLLGERVGIFKPTAESPHGIRNPHLWIRLRNMIQNLFPNNRCTVEQYGALAEMFASKLSEVLGWTLVPTTRKVSFKSNSLVDHSIAEEGSFQLYVSGSHDGFKHFGMEGWFPKSIPTTPAATELLISRESFRKFALLEYLICNIDGNFGNMLFQEGSNEARAIDSWFSMPKSAPNSYYDMRGLHPWTDIVWANEEIDDESFALVRSERENILTAFDHLYQHVDEADRAAIRSYLVTRIETFLGFQRPEGSPPIAELANRNEIPHTWRDLAGQHHLQY